ncbi:ATP-binding protein [Aeromonas media]|uniref:ATP-binding protein n=1 Tax=Aeromonas media TaxID=651 RepID=UPI003D1BB463
MRRWRLRWPGTLGRRLRLSFVAILVLALAMGGTAYVMWDRLGRQVGLIVEESLPAIDDAYRLERASSRLLLQLAQLRDAPTLGDFQRLSRQVSVTLRQMRQSALSSSPDNRETPSQRQAFAELGERVERHAGYLRQQLDHQEMLSQMRKRSAWLHQDLVEEVAPLLQEVEWHLTGMVANQEQRETLAEVIKEFSALQDLTFKENELQGLVEEVIAQRYQQDLESAFLFIGYKIDEIDGLTARLADYPSTVSYRQILEEIVTLVKPGGQLQQLLAADVRTHQRLEALRPQLDESVSRYHARVSRVVTEANQALRTLSHDSHRMVATGKTVILVGLSLSVLIGGLVLVVLIGRRLIRRLDILGQDLARVAAGQLDQPIRTLGRDEIGRLGESLRSFCEQLQQMEKSNALNLINNTQASLITCHQDGTIESVNPSALTLFQQSAIAPEQPLWQLFPGEGCTVLAAQFQPDQPLQRFGSSECTLAVELAGQVRYLHFNFRRFEQARRSKFIITITDVTRQELTARELGLLVAERTRELTENNRRLAEEVTRREQAQRNLLQTQDELIQAAKMAVVGQAMTSLAHELNQPLSAMMTYLYTSRMALATGESQRLGQELDKIERLAQRMSRIITALRNFARKSPQLDALCRLDLHELAEQSLLLVENRARREACQLHNELPPGLWIQGDPGLVEQVLVNLLVNGLDAIAGRESRQLRLILLERGSARVRIALCDSGPGFAEAILPSLFTPFTSSKEVGLGLGLTICRSLLARCAGEIGLASALEGGAMVVLEFTVDPSALPMTSAYDDARE